MYNPLVIVEMHPIRDPLQIVPLHLMGPIEVR